MEFDAWNLGFQRFRERVAFILGTLGIFFFGIYTINRSIIPDGRMRKGEGGRKNDTRLVDKGQ